MSEEWKFDNDTSKLDVTDEDKLTEISVGSHLIDRKIGRRMASSQDCGGSFKSEFIWSLVG